MSNGQGSGRANLAAALLLCLCFGSIHSFGVLVAPLEHVLHANRSLVSLGYSVATAALTAGVFLGPRLGALMPLRQLILSVCLASAFGLAVAALVPSTLTLLLGYGLLFGLANGVAYGLALELAAEAMPRKPATGIGLATAVYGFGAVVFSFVLDAAADRGGAEFALLVLAGALLACGSVAALPLRLRAAAPSPGSSQPRSAGPVTLALWIYYLLMTASGLMVIAHAPAIAGMASGSLQSASLASMAVSGSSILGGYVGGLLVERWPGWPAFLVPAVLQSAALALLASLSMPMWTIALLALCGLCYGTAIAVVPGYVRIAFGLALFARTYALVFTAWGVAGFLGPFAAGLLYDLHGTYTLALVAAAVLSCLVAALSRLPTVFPFIAPKEAR